MPWRADGRWPSPRGWRPCATVLDLVGQDALVVAPRHAYHGSIGQLGDLEARGRIRATLVDIADTDAVVAALDDAAILWIESPTNPALEVADVERLVAAGHEAGARVVVDNTFATPLLQQPLELGADIVLHSVTKFLAGHSDVVMGALVVRDDQLYDVLKGRRDLVGAIPGTLEAWLALRGLRTLHLRVERSQANAAELARRLEAHPAVDRGALPGLRRESSRSCCRRRRAGRPAHPLHVAVGARHVARQRRVDLRAPPPLEDRGPDHPRGPRADVGGHRGRRRPLGRPRAGPATIADRAAGRHVARAPWASPIVETKCAPAVSTRSAWRCRLDQRGLCVSRSRPWCRGR